MEIPLRDRADPDLRVIETMLRLPGDGIVREALHLARCRRTCEALGIPFDAPTLATRLADAAAETPQRLRLTVGTAGDIDVTATAFDLTPPSGPLRVAVSATRLDPDDPFLRLKTTRRALYDRALATKPEGTGEVLFFNSRDELCEGAYTNVFLRFGDGALVTPPLSSGLLPGILRQSLIERGEAREAVVPRETLHRPHRLFIGNSLRGLMEAQWDTPPAG